MIKKPVEVQKAIKQTEKLLDILSAVIICHDKIRIRGKFEMN